MPITLSSVETFTNKQGNTFSLEWENPRLLTSIDHDEMEKMFLHSFLLGYRSCHALDDLTDHEVIVILKKYFHESIIPHLLVNSVYYISAKHEGQIVGFALFEKITEEEFYVAELAIHPDYWQQGLGKALSNAILRKVPSIRKMVLLTEWMNRRAQEFYEALGYRPSTYMHEGYDPAQYRAYEIEINTP